MYKYIFAFFTCLLISSEISADPKASFTIATPIKSIEDTIVDMEELRARVRDINRHSKDFDLSNILKFEVVSDQILPTLLLSCGNPEDFADFFERHEFRKFHLSLSEETLLRDCLAGVFEFADRELGFAAPGLYKRFSGSYLSAALELGYECGYRSQRLFSRFALSV